MRSSQLHRRVEDPQSTWAPSTVCGPRTLLESGGPATLLWLPAQRLDPAPLIPLLLRCCGHSCQGNFSSLPKAIRHLARKDWTKLPNKGPSKMLVDKANEDREDLV